MKKYAFYLLLLALMTLASCQKANIADKFQFREIPADEVQNYRIPVTIKESREVSVLDDDDNAVTEITLEKGTKVTLLGLCAQIGGLRTIPSIYNGSRLKWFVANEMWYAQLKDGRRIIMTFPERSSYDPEMFAPDKVAMYYSKQGDYGLSEVEKMYNERLEKSPEWWKKALLHVSMFIDLSNYYVRNYSLNNLLYKDGTYYKYYPATFSFPVKWSIPQEFWRLLQTLLSSMLMFIFFIFVLPWLCIRAAGLIRFFPNWLVKILACFLYWYILKIVCAWMEVTLAGRVWWQFIVLIIMIWVTWTEVKRCRCPHCHRFGLIDRGTTYGNWQNSTKEYDQEEVKSIEKHLELSEDGTVLAGSRTYSNYGIKHYIINIRSRTVTDHLKCPHCGRDINYRSQESHSSKSGTWK